MGIAARPDSPPETERRAPRPPAQPREAADYPGPVLRAWIELEVDTRINLALRNLAQGELSKALPPAREEPPAAFAEAPRELEETRQEVRAVAQSQARLLQVVGGLSSELSQLGRDALQGQQELGGLSEALEQLRSSMAVWRSETATELRATGMRGRGEAETLRLEAQAAASSRVREDLDRGLAGFRQELVSLKQGFEDVSRYIEAWEPWLAGHLSDFERRVTLELRAALRRQQEALLAYDDPLLKTDARLHKEHGRARAASARRSSTALRADVGR